MLSVEVVVLILYQIPCVAVAVAGVVVAVELVVFVEAFVLSAYMYCHHGAAVPGGRDHDGKVSGLSR